MVSSTPLLIVGAGPFGLAMAAWASGRGIDHIIVGEPMGFWKRHMPRGMCLRSATDWHYDPFDEATIERYLGMRGMTPAEVDPLPLDIYLEYAEWFRRQKQIEPLPRRVRRLDRSARFEATLDDGSTISADNVVLAVGFRYFHHVPEPFPALLPEGRWSHTGDCVDFAPLRGKRVLIIGGRQSAFEWAALLREAGAERVDLCYRHPTPAFELSDWSFVNPTVARMSSDPGWFRRLTPEEKERLNRRQWAEGRLKLEPWLAPRIRHENIGLHPETTVTSCEQRGNDLVIGLSSGEVLSVDHVILATGYKVDVGRIPFLAAGNVLSDIELSNGFPVLSEHFESSVPGLYFTSMCAVQDFGAFFGFTSSVRVSAHLIGASIQTG